MRLTADHVCSMLIYQWYMLDICEILGVQYEDEVVFTAAIDDGNIFSKRK